MGDGKRVLDEEAGKLTLRITISAHVRAVAGFAALEGEMWQR